jgi:hypothetical protein
MRREQVDSTSIAWIGYDSRRHELEIEFRESGDVYLYSDVPVEEYESFLSAESKGNYLNRVFKPREYRYVIVRKGKKEQP